MHILYNVVNKSKWRHIWSNLPSGTPNPGKKKKKSSLHTHKVSNLISKPILPVPDIVWFHISTTDGNGIQANYLQETEQEVEVSSKNQIGKRKETRKTQKALPQKAL